MKSNVFKRNGFTLIELMAVIVIIAIIAVITVPIVLNVIEDSKRGSAKDSAYGYVDSVNRLYYSNSLGNPEVDIEDGVYNVSELKTMGVSVSGDEPSDGWVEIVDSEVVSYSLKFGDYVVTKYVDRDIVILKDGIIRHALSEVNVAEVVSSLDGQENADGAKYLTTPTDIYFNPIIGMECSSSDSVSTPGTISSCMHWYLYSVKGDYANMILDHNITGQNAQSGAWALKSDYEAGLTPKNDGGFDITEGATSKAVSAGITYPGILSFPEYSNSVRNSQISRGPVTALNTLKDLTSNWKTDVPKVPNSSGIDEHVILSDKNMDMFQIDYGDYHARLITYTEAAYLGCTTQSGSCRFSNNTNFISHQNVQYLTSSVVNLVGMWNVVYIIGEDNRLYTASPDSVLNGIRPVVTVPIVYLSSLSED